MYTVGISDLMLKSFGVHIKNADYGACPGTSGSVALKGMVQIFAYKETPPGFWCTDSGITLQDIQH